MTSWFVYCRDHPGTEAARSRLLEAHWSYMDDHAARMTARGPTLAEDGDTATGSLHIVDLPDVASARAFAFEEPNYRAGVYAAVFLRRFRNLLGRTMWEFPNAPGVGGRFLVIGHGRTEVGKAQPSLEEQRLFAADRTQRDRLIVYGPLLSDDGAAWLGSALAVELPTREAVEALLAREPGALADAYERVEIHRWEFGGRR
jgi:uncharacterized protein